MISPMCARTMTSGAVVAMADDAPMLSGSSAVDTIGETGPINRAKKPRVS